MVNSLKIILFTAVVCALMVGCSSDRCQIVVHPSIVKPNDTMSVVLANLYALGSLSNKALVAGNRDSFHLLAGIPQGWDVQSVSFYAAKNFNIATMLRSSTSSLSLLADTFPSYLSKTTPMTLDTGLSNAFLNRRISSHDSANKVTVSVNTSSVKKWVGFSAPIGILIAAGSDMDTTISKDSLFQVLGENGIDTNTVKNASPYVSLIQTVGITIIPIVAVLKLKTGAESAVDTLYYYTKTAKVQVSDSTQQTDKGDMVFVPISVANVAVKQGLPKSRQGSFNIITDRSGVKFYFDKVSSHQSVAIYSLCGEMVQKINSINGYAFWNGIDRLGKQVPAGSYLAKIGDGEMEYSRLVGMVR